MSSNQQKKKLCLGDYDPTRAECKTCSLDDWCIQEAQARDGYWDELERISHYWEECEEGNVW